MKDDTSFRTTMAFQIITKTTRVKSLVWILLWTENEPLFVSKSMPLFGGKTGKTGKTGQVQSVAGADPTD